MRNCAILGVVNLPNAITLFRILLVIVFAASASLADILGVHLYTVAFIAFIIATISDWLDGYLARKLDMVTSFGKLIDPLADKILVCTTFVYLSVAQLVPVWVTALIIGREFLITGLRQLAIEHGIVIPADIWGKWKTTLQLAFCIDALILLMIGSNPPDSGVSRFFYDLCARDSYVYQISLWGAVLLTAWSAINYSWKTRSLFKAS